VMLDDVIAGVYALIILAVSRSVLRWP